MSATHSHTFTAMTRQELRIFFSDWFCGCGNPEDAAATLLRLLELHPAYEHGKQLEELVPDTGARYLLLYSLDRYELTEHGGSVMGAWLTPKGEALRDGLRAVGGLDGLEALFDAHYCIHGEAHEENPDHDCMKAGEPVSWAERTGWKL